MKQFEFLGKILAKAVYENILVELPFAKFFLAKLLGKYNYGKLTWRILLNPAVNDLAFLDQDLHKNLRKLRTMNVDDLGITFTTFEDVLGKNQLVELIPGGKVRPIFAHLIDLK